MPSNKRKVVLDSDSEDDEEIVYVLGKKTIESFKKFFLDSYGHALRGFCLNEDEEDPAKVYLQKKMYNAEEDYFDADATLELLKEEKNHMDVMTALAAGREYDLDFEDQASYLDEEQAKEMRRILDLMSRWYEVAEDQKKKQKKK